MDGNAVRVRFVRGDSEPLEGPVSTGTVYLTQYRRGNYLGAAKRPPETTAAGFKVKF